MATGSPGSGFNTTVNNGDVPTAQQFANEGASIADLYKPSQCYAPPMGYVAFGGGGGFALAWDKVPFRLKCTGTGDSTQLVYVPIPLRKGQVLTSVDVRIEKIDLSTTTLKLARVTGLASTGGGPTESNLVTGTSAASGDIVVTLTPGSPITQDGTSEYFIIWVPGVSGDWLYGVKPY